MKTFEYKSLEFDAETRRWIRSVHLESEELDVVLNNMGAQGWELVSTVDYAIAGHTQKVILLFKRERS